MTDILHYNLEEDQKIGFSLMLRATPHRIQVVSSETMRQSVASSAHLVISTKSNQLSLLQKRFVRFMTVIEYSRVSSTNLSLKIPGLLCQLPLRRNLAPAPILLSLFLPSMVM